MLSSWWKKFLAPMLASTAAVAGGAVSAAALLSPAAANATVITLPPGDSPQDATAVGTVKVGDSISFTGLNPPVYWEFTWGDATATPDISSQGSFASNVEASPFGNLQLYSVTGADSSGWDTTLLYHTAFATSGSFASADLGTVPLIESDNYVVGISDPTGPAMGSISFGAVPEPSSLSLLGSVLALLGFARWRRARRA